MSDISFTEKNKHFQNNHYHSVENLDELPFIDLFLYDKQFRDAIIPRVYSARGCNNRCIYCVADNSKNRIYRKKSAQLVVDEIEYLKEQYGKKFFVMGDLEFLCDHKHAVDICKEIIKRKLDVKWWCQIFPPNITEEAVSLMRDAGNIQIALGIESDSPESLESMNKKISFIGHPSFRGFLTDIQFVNQPPRFQTKPIFTACYKFETDIENYEFVGKCKLL